AFSRDSRWLAYGQPGGVIGLVDLNGEEKEKSFPPGATPYHLAFAPDGSKLAVSAQNTVQVRQTSSGDVLKTFSHPANVYGVDWSSDGRLIAAACANGSVYLWNYHRPLITPQAV